MEPMECSQLNVRNPEDTAYGYQHGCVKSFDRVRDGLGLVGSSNLTGAEVV